MNDAVVAGDGEYEWVGKRTVRPDGVDKVTGRATRADYNMAGMLYGAVLHSPHAHARILKIDTSKAEALKGMEVVITAADWPGIWIRKNQRHCAGELSALVRQSDGAEQGLV